MPTTVVADNLVCLTENTSNNPNIRERYYKLKNEIADILTQLEERNFPFQEGVQFYIATQLYQGRKTGADCLEKGVIFQWVNAKTNNVVWNLTERYGDIVLCDDTYIQHGTLDSFIQFLRSDYNLGMSGSNRPDLHKILGDDINNLFICRKRRKRKKLIKRR